MLRVILTVGVVAFFISPMSAIATPKDRIACLQTEQVELFLLDRNLKNIIEAATSPCDAAAKIRVKSAHAVESALITGTPMAIIEDLSRTHQFLWHFDGYELTAQSIKNIDTKLVAANGFSAKALQARLLELGWLASDNTIHDTPDGTILRLSGSADFISFLQSVIAMEKVEDEGSDVAVYRNGRLVITTPFGS